MKIWCISDTHCRHKELVLPDPNEIDMVIHAGDASNVRDFSFNEAEMRDFLIWYNSLPYKYKIYVPGNHDTSVEQGMFDFDEYPNIIVLNHKYISIEDIKIFGSPYTPSFGHGWAYNVSRTKIDLKWKDIPKDTDIIITHGPPKGILDYTLNEGVVYTQCGCKALLNKVKEVNPKLHIFGHIHNEKNVYNSGIYQEKENSTKYCNASVNDLSYTVCNNGLIIEL